MGADREQEISARLDREQGTIRKHGSQQWALVYPSPYQVGMSSLGFQTIYRILNGLEDTVAERAFKAEDHWESAPLRSYESRRPVGDFDVLAFSVAYELEIAGLFECLQDAGIPILARERSENFPLVVAGGPLTFSNPIPLGPFVDVVLLGEAEDTITQLSQWLQSYCPRTEKTQLLQFLAQQPGFYVPLIHGEVLPPVAQAEDRHLPAYAPIITPDAALSNMFLIEAERGCSRGCTFCVMRRSTNGGMRLANPEAILDAIPKHAKRVGLVGAAVSDHPKTPWMVHQMVERGLEVGLSSLRADRLTPDFVKDLQRGGYRTLTIASDGASERLRIGMEKKIRAKHLIRATELARDAKMPQLKVYMMIGSPNEQDDDIEELVDFTREQSAVAGPKMRLFLGIAPFVAKKNTPLDGAPFVGIKESERRIKRIRQALKGQAEVRPISARWAWVEYCLAQGGMRAGLAAFEAWRAGARFADYRRAFNAYDCAGAERRIQNPKQPSGIRPQLTVLNG